MTFNYSLAIELMIHIVRLTKEPKEKLTLRQVEENSTRTKYK